MKVLNASAGHDPIERVPQQCCRATIRSTDRESAQCRCHSLQQWRTFRALQKSVLYRHSHNIWISKDYMRAFVLCYGPDTGRLRSSSHGRYGCQSVNYCASSTIDESLARVCGGNSEEKWSCISHYWRRRSAVSQWRFLTLKRPCVKNFSWTRRSSDGRHGVYNVHMAVLLVNIKRKGWLRHM